MLGNPPNLNRLYFPLRAGIPVVQDMHRHASRCQHLGDGQRKPYPFRAERHPHSGMHASRVAEAVVVTDEGLCGLSDGVAYHKNERQVVATDTVCPYTIIAEIVHKDEVSHKEEHRHRHLRKECRTSRRQETSPCPSNGGAFRYFAFPFPRGG